VDAAFEELAGVVGGESEEFEAEAKGWKGSWEEGEKLGLTI
jgi:hypothetical protein